MATAPEPASYYCSDPNCLYCKDLRLAKEQLSGERDFIADVSKNQSAKRQ